MAREQNDIKMISFGCYQVPHSKRVELGRLIVQVQLTAVAPQHARLAKGDAKGL